MTTRSVPTSYIGPVRGVRASYGVVWGLFRVFTLNGLFSSLSVIFANYRHTLKPGDSGLRGQFLQVTLVPCEVFVPLRGRLGAGSGFHPLNGLFSSLSVIFLQIIVGHSQTVSLGTTRSVPTSYIGPVRGVRASYGVVWGLVRVFTHLTAMFSSLSVLIFANYHRTLKPGVP